MSLINKMRGTLDQAGMFAAVSPSTIPSFLTTTKLLSGLGY